MLLFGGYLLISWILRALVAPRRHWSLNEKIRSRMALGIAGLLILHGLNALKVLVLLGISYCISKLKGSSLNPLLSWSYALGVLFFLEFLRLETLMAPGLASWLQAPFNWFPGFLPRWYVTFNMTILRLISFNMDRYYQERASYSPLQHHEQCSSCSSGGEICERRRIQESPGEDLFSIQAFLAYTLYLPTFVAGPIITFNNFISQLGRPCAISRRETIIYGLRWLFSLGLMEFGLHHLFPVAVKNAQAWSTFRPLDFTILAYLNLKFLWLKLLIIWRYFRLLALLDGIVVTENMTRCMSNTHSGLGFWRSWHRSFNQWIIRYMYIPLGGRRRAVWNIWPIFTFVAIWHDIRLHLLVWSWLICLFIVPELVLSWLAGRLALEKRWPHYYRYAAAAAAGGNIFLMGVANLVGFVVGVDGIGVLLRSLLGWEGLIFGLLLSATLFAVGHVQLQIRSTERALGILKNY